MPPLETAHELAALGKALFAGRSGIFMRSLVCGAAFVGATHAAGRLRPELRAFAQVAASLVVLSSVMTPLVTALMAVHALALFWVVERWSAGWWRPVGILLLLALLVIAPIWWLPVLPGYEGKVREFVTFGSNLALLRSWGYAYDRLRRPDPVPPTLTEYGLFMFYVPTFVNGPFVSLSQFRRSQLAAFTERRLPSLPVVLRAEWPSVLRIVRGTVAVPIGLSIMFLSDTSGYEYAGQGLFQTWELVIRIYFAWYVTFWGWMEVAIGLGRLAGVVLPESFNAPYFAFGVADFWRRWNMTFNHWLSSYVYLPLGGAYVRGRSGERHLEWRNTAAVFAVMAAWHLVGGLKLLGPTAFPPFAYVPWTLWAIGNTAAVILTRSLHRPAGLGLGAVAGIAATFAFCCVSHTTAVFPPTMPIAQLGEIYVHLVHP